MNTVLEARIRAAGAEMSKPGRWRVALDQLDQATQQILASPEFDAHAAQLALDNLHSLYQWSSFMQNHELRRLNSALLELSTAFSSNR